jgi:transposase
LAEVEVPAHAPKRERAFDSYTERLRALTTRKLHQPDNRRLAKHQAKHGPAWFVLLLDPEVPATHHRAGQGLKAPIVNRKGWGGNRTEAGAEAQGIVCSVLETCKNVAIDAVEPVSQAIRGIFTSLFTIPSPTDR